MKVLQSIWSLASENGGPTRSTIGLSKALAQAGVDVVLVSHVPDKVTQFERGALKQSGVHFVEGRGNGLFTSLADSRKLLDELKPDLVHVQGLWKMSTHAMNIAAAERGISIVISPRGMLAPWALSVKKWKKRLGLALYQRSDLKRATAFHVTSEAEARHVRDFGLSQPIIQVANGVTMPLDSGMNHEKHGIGNHIRIQTAASFSTWGGSGESRAADLRTVCQNTKNSSAGERWAAPSPSPCPFHERESRSCL